MAFVITRSITRPLAVLVQRLRSVTRVCLTQLGTGLEATARGDLTVAAEAGTKKIGSSARDEIGAAARVVDELIDGARDSIAAYETTRASLGAMIGQVSESARGVSAASEQFATSSEETGRRDWPSHPCGGLRRRRRRAPGRHGRLGQRHRGAHGELRGRDRPHDRGDRRRRAGDARGRPPGRRRRARRPACHGQRARRLPRGHDRDPRRWPTSRQRDQRDRRDDHRHRRRRPTCWPSTPPSRPPAPASRAAASRSWPTRSASWPRSPAGLRDPHHRPSIEQIQEQTRRRSTSSSEGAQRTDESASDGRAGAPGLRGHRRPRSTT